MGEELCVGCCADRRGAGICRSPNVDIEDDPRCREDLVIRQGYTCNRVTGECEFCAEEFTGPEPPTDSPSAPIGVEEEEEIF
eukprot:TRINITY_DN16779_c0_g1_i1.p2 TRINITY_DN16779_c0_g1~~TRINITY_DN16779_c0_g1_i1.p2  ORF type:complete len:82 (-),score=15.18 TRINITY_DN16779_c0_g1_i1:255-500(-)